MAAQKLCNTKFNSFVFLDLELTGNTAHNEITEISLVAVHSTAMQESQNAECTPRVVDKLVLCVTPVEKVSTLGFFLLLLVLNCK